MFNKKYLNINWGRDQNPSLSTVRWQFSAKAVSVPQREHVLQPGSPVASGLTPELLEGGSSRLLSEVTFSSSVLKKDGTDESGRGIAATNHVLQEAPFSGLATATKLS